MCKTVLCSALVVLFACVAGAQTTSREPERRNPFASDANAIHQGSILYRQECMYCHGPAARGGSRGPDLTSGNWVHGGSDGEIFSTISTGVDGTSMAPHRFKDDEIWQLLSYLRSLQQAPTPAAGNAAHGRELFNGDANCSLCHMVAGRGGRLGPDLTRIGAARPLPYLVDSIRDPDKSLTRHGYQSTSLNDEPYDTVTVVTRAGKIVIGTPVNEDTFTIQIMDASETVHSFDKKSLKSLKHERKSLMPAYNQDTLSDKDLQDIVAYLQSLRGPAPKPAKGLVNAAE